MSDHLNNIASYSPWLIPILLFAFGLSSSLHCISMCGPLSLLASQNSKSSWRYQFGRLLGYLSIGLILSFVSQETLKFLLLKIGIWFWYFILISLIGTLAFIISKNFHIKLPNFFNFISKRLMSLAIKQKNQSLRAFAIGVASVFLPCGVLYLAIISLAALSSPSIVAIGVLFFWMGTLPLLHFGLPLVKSLLARFSVKSVHLNTAIIIILCFAVLLNRYPQFIVGVVHRCH